MPDRDKRPVTVEDLLKVKRSERPDGEFWKDWQTEMRSRLVAARQEPRPWWKDAFHRSIIVIARHHIAVGAACVMVLGVVLVRQSYTSFSPLPGELPASGVSLQPQTQAPAAALATQNFSQVASLPVVAMITGDAPQTREASNAITRLDYAERESPAARAIALNLAAMEQVEFGLRPRYSLGHVFEMPDSERLELAVREARHDHFTETSSAALVSEELVSQARRQDRLMSRLNAEARLDGGARGPGSRGDRFSLRF